MKPYLLIFCLWISQGSLAQAIQEDPEAAFSQASREGKNLLLLFSGSDWCIPCIQFEKKVLLDSSFQKFASRSLVILVADFPQKRKISKSLQAAYESLADQYDPSGIFPRIIILTPDKKFLGSISYQHQSADEFLKELNVLITPG